MGLSDLFPNGGMASFLLRLLIRFLQFVMAGTAAGLYAQYLNSAREYYITPSPPWIYAEVVAGLSGLTVILYMLPFVRPAKIYPWDFVLLVLWMALFGVFARIYLHRGDSPRHRYKHTNTTRMKAAMWVDIVNAVLWFGTFLYGIIKYFRERRQLRREMLIAEAQAAEESNIDPIVF